MPLINCKVELKLRWMIHCVLLEAETDNDDANPNNIIFTNQDTTLYYSTKNQNLSKLLRKRFERLAYWNEYKTKSESKNRKVKIRILFAKGIIKKYNVIINGKLATGQGEDYTTGCLLDYEYIKKHYALITVDLSRQKQLFIEQLKKLDSKGNATDAVADQNIFVLTILEKIKQARLKFSQGSVTVL